VFKGFHQD